MKRIIFIIIITLYVLFLAVSCTGVKHLTKTIDKAFEKKDSVVHKDSASVKTDTSKYNTEIVIEYSDSNAMSKLVDGSDTDWQPFVVDVTTDPLPSVHSTQRVKRIIIKTKTDLHVKDSVVIHDNGSIKTVSKTETVKKEVAKKTTSYWWVLLLIIPALFLLYQKYKSKIPGWLKFIP